MPKKKPDHEKAKKLSISIPREVWNLAEIRMFNLRQGDSEYIRELIKADTYDLWLQKHQESPLLMAAEEPPKYGEKVNETAPPARRSSVSYTPKRIKPTK
jgi:hypothetical protein